MPSPKQLPVLLVCLALAAGLEAQERAGPWTLEGRVLAAGPETPFVGAEIAVVGTGVSVCADRSGRFEIPLAAGDQRLRIGPLGFPARAVVVLRGDRPERVFLPEHVIELEGVVVSGVAATIEAREGASAVATVEGEELGRVPASGVDDALRGRVVGASVEGNSGAPGGGFQIRIRGLTTILGDANPVVVVDGVVVSDASLGPGTGVITGGQENPQNRLADLNPGDVERVEVLKGASASSRYGPRAGNGVVVITTKAGRPSADAPAPASYRCFVGH